MWQGEPLAWTYPSRIVALDNIAVVAQAAAIQGRWLRVGSTGLGGESEAHRRLKLYTAAHPEILGLRATAQSEVEHRFVTGDICCYPSHELTHPGSVRLTDYIFFRITGDHCTWRHVKDAVPHVARHKLPQLQFPRP